MVGGELTTGVGATNAKPLDSIPFWLPTVTTTSACDAACCGVTAVSVVEFTKATLPAGAPPMVTVAPAEKFAPTRVTAVPPSVVPVFGVIEVIRGAVDDGSTPDPPQDRQTSEATR